MSEPAQALTPSNPVVYTKRLGSRTVLVIELPSAVTERMTTPGRQRVINIRCKPVEVLAVNEEAAAQHRPPFGKAQSIRAGQIFESAALASDALGFASNAVAIKLSTQRQNLRRAGKPSGPDHVTLRGITMAYIDEPKRSNL